MSSSTTPQRRKRALSDSSVEIIEVRSVSKTKKRQKTTERQPTPPPLEEQRPRVFRHAPPKAFHAVWQRATSERFFVLQRERNDEADCPQEIFQLAGTTGNVYSILISREPSCNCPHALKGNQCKHTIYIMHQVLKAPYHLVYQLGLLGSELRQIYDRLPRRGADDDAENRKAVEGECAICYMDLDEQDTKSTVWCRAACGQNLHKVCFDTWARTCSGRAVTCPLCRSTWEMDDKTDALASVDTNRGVEGEDGYINVADQLGISGERVPSAPQIQVRTFGVELTGEWAWGAAGIRGNTKDKYSYPRHLHKDTLTCFKEGRKYLSWRPPAVMEPIPPTVRALMAPYECTPKDYVIQEILTPTITLSTQVILRVHAFTFTPAEFRGIAGEMKLIFKPTYPSQLAMEGAGEVVAVGSAVKNLKVGDAAYGVSFEKPVFRGPPAGLASEYAVLDERMLLPKPSHLSFADVACLTGVTVTAVQAFQRGMLLSGQQSLEGKTVFVGGGLSATGSVGVQYAKNALGAGKVITTLSTGKMALVDELIPGVVDEKIDYTKTKVADAVPKQSVDFTYHTQATAPLSESIDITKPGTGALISIAGVPDKAVVVEILGADRFPWWLGIALDTAQLWYKWLLLGSNIKYTMISGSPDVREDLEKAGEAIARGQVKAVPTTVDFDDLEAVRRVCSTAYSGKGGVGQIVVRIR
ncbi:hypothetical protein LLEC1_02595 [Akanthomyces lecanii]|uniref:RING-type domain-containing protein n=1 Tax=Cordyceps confragosa TaxID=2714763 RepID=A0A179IIE3_CORDF|nr:hypothetical protein LLEC1_02595 [Akanthomyces lecanii]